MKKDLFKFFSFKKKLAKINLSYRSSHQRCSFKIEFLKNLTKCKAKHLSWMFNKDSGLRSASLLKKTLQQRCFPVNFVKFCWTSRRLLLFVIYLTVSFWKEVLYICWNLLLLEKSTKTDNFTIFSFSKYILYCESIYTIDQNIYVRNHVSLMR